MGTKYLSDVLSGEEIINEKNQKICIISGVGSGKNYFVENELSKYGNILYISSRRAKVNEILENEICSNTINWENYGADVVAVTNFGVERIVQNKMFSENLDEIIKHFDFIVLDEAHSLCSDATFSSSSFHVFEFLKYVSDKYPRIKIIAMTGTPEPIQRYLHDFTVFDKREDCINVLPEIISIIDRETALDLIGRMSLQEKTVYYSNSAKRIVSGKNSLVSRLKDKGFSDDEIGICMSDYNAQNLQHDYSGLKEKCKLTKEAIIQESKLYSQCRILLTTSSLKEGVNIEDDNIHIAFCESHLLSEIQQFAGRMRKGLKVLYIISDAKQHTVDDNEVRKFYLELIYACNAVKSAVNPFIEETIKNPKSALYMEEDFYDRGYLDIAELWQGEISLAALGGSIVPMYIQMIEKSNQYLMFNHLKSCFGIYANRFIEQRRVNRILRDCTWLNELRDFSERNKIEYIEKVVMDNIDTDKIMEYCESNRDVIWVEDDKKTIKWNLCYMMLLDPKSQIRTINNSFETYQIPYRIENVDTSRNGKNMRGIRITEKPFAERIIIAESNDGDDKPNKKAKPKAKKTVSEKTEKPDEDLQKMIDFTQNEIIESGLTPQMLNDMKSLSNKDYSYAVILKSFYNCKEKIAKASWNVSFETSFHKFKYFLGIVKNDLSDNFLNYKSQIEKEKRFYDEMFNGWAERIASGEITIDYYKAVQGKEISKEELEKYVNEVEKRVSMYRAQEE